MTAFGVDAFNIDDRCAQVLGSYRAIPRSVRGAVARECERFVDEHIATKRSFAVETTVRTAAAIKQAKRASKESLATELTFIARERVSLNIARVLQRAQAGGYGASERDITDIYEARIAMYLPTPGERRGVGHSPSSERDPGWMRTVEDDDQALAGGADDPKLCSRAHYRKDMFKT